MRVGDAQSGTVPISKRGGGRPDVEKSWTSVCTMPLRCSRACDCAAGSCSKRYHAISGGKVSNLGLKAADHVGAQSSHVTNEDGRR
jgi:hypothetical protein